MVKTAFSRRNFLTLSGIVSAAALLPASIARAVYIHDDGRCERPARIDTLGGPGTYTDDTSVPLGAGALEDARKSGLTAVNLTVSGVGSYAHNYDETIKNIAYWSAEIAAHPDRLMQIRRSSDLEAARCSGKLRFDLRFSGRHAYGRGSGSRRHIPRSRRAHLPAHLQPSQSRRRRLSRAGQCGTVDVWQETRRKAQRDEIARRPFACGRTHDARSDCRIEDADRDFAYGLRRALRHCHATRPTTN